VLLILIVLFYLDSLMIDLVWFETFENMKINAKALLFLIKLNKFTVHLSLI